MRALGPGHQKSQSGGPDHRPASCRSRSRFDRGLPGPFRKNRSAGTSATGWRPKSARAGHGESYPGPASSKPCRGCRKERRCCRATWPAGAAAAAAKSAAASAAARVDAAAAAAPRRLATRSFVASWPRKNSVAAPGAAHVALMSRALAKGVGAAAVVRGRPPVQSRLTPRHPARAPVARRQPRHRQHCRPSRTCGDAVPPRCQNRLHWQFAHGPWRRLTRRFFCLAQGPCCDRYRRPRVLLWRSHWPVGARRAVSGAALPRRRPVAVHRAPL